MSVDLSIKKWWEDGHPIISDRWCRKTPFGDLNWLGRACNVYYHRTLWLRPWFWQLVLKRREPTAWGSWLATVWCRIKGHCGEIFYNPGGFEPDHRCKGCGEIVG